MPPDVDRLQKQLEMLSRDLHQVVSALTSLHAKNESDIDDLRDDLKTVIRDIDAIKAEFHKLDKNLAVINTQYDLVVKAMPDHLRSVHARVDSALAVRADPTPAVGIRTDRTAPHEERSSAPDVLTWATQTKALAVKWGPWLTTATVLLTSTLRNCGVQVEEQAASTVITLPVTAQRAPALRDAGTP